MGRDALSLAGRFLDLRAEDTVLLPSYLCREVLRPFLGRNRVELYDLRPDLTVDPEEIKRKLAVTRAKMMMIINYFGFLQPHRREIKEICAERGIILMEDCAHSLLTEGSGEVGDLSVYSFRKILPLPDGGGLKINMKATAVTTDYYPRMYSNILSVLIILKSLFAVRTEILSRSGLANRTKNHAPRAATTANNSRILPLSSFAHNGMSNMSFSEIIEKRREDYRFWQEITERSDRIAPVFSHLSPGVCPLGFPVKAKDRDAMKSRLEEDGIFLKTHWHLPEAVGREFFNSHALSKLTMTFPVYPELGRKEREGILRLLHL
jgi:dTDP-4-amino-4,6-dideoxygalactose transaminase